MVGAGTSYVFWHQHTSKQEQWEHLGVLGGVHEGVCRYMLHKGDEGGDRGLLRSGTQRVGGTGPPEPPQLLDKHT